MYKNALGRSDSYHIRMSTDFPLLIVVFFFLNYFLKFLDDNFRNLIPRQHALPNIIYIGKKI